MQTLIGVPCVPRSKECVRALHNDANWAAASAIRIGGQQQKCGGSECGISSAQQETDKGARLFIFYSHSIARLHVEALLGSAPRLEQCFRAIQALLACDVCVTESKKSRPMLFKFVASVRKAPLPARCQYTRCLIHSFPRLRLAGCCWLASCC